MVLVLVLVASSLSVSTATSLVTLVGVSRPNIVVLMLDDMPPEPRLIERMPFTSAFLADGVSFSNYYGNDPLCCPGRAAFLSGQYSHHHGQIDNDGTRFDPTITLATRLQDAGYWTAMAGKYLNGLSEIPDKTPPGWDRLAVTAGRYYDYQLWRDGAVEDHGSAPEDYSTDVISDAAARILRDAPAGKPIYLQITPFAPHSGSPDALPTVAPRHVTDPRCKGIGVRGGPAYNESDMSDKPAFLQEQPLQPYPTGWPLIRACRALLSVDEMVARVAGLLAEQGRLDETLFLLTADNGMAWGDHRWQTKQIAYATPLPLYVRWPGDQRAGTMTTYVTNVDLAPSLAAVAGTSMGVLANGRPPDGLDISRLFSGRGSLGRTALLEERSAIGQGGQLPDGPGWRAIRTTDKHALGRWHYIEWADGSTELYDAQRDPYELRSRNGAAFEQIRATLAAELEALYGD
ncbi:MAG: sulfatase-like hydrolase/transferase [Chloroflexi bacterium]|nr:sulfatase-like hydrolase/transferase [Chloroflexota bacterium]